MLHAGAILTAGGTSVAGVHTDWGVLQALGLAGLICLAFVRLPTWTRFLIGMLLLVAYQLALDAWWLDEVVRSNHGGFLGAISWAALLVLSTAVADLWRRGRASYALCCTALVVVAAISMLVVPVSKHRVSLSFVLLTLAISAVAFLAVELASRAVPDRAGFLTGGERTHSRSISCSCSCSRSSRSRPSPGGMRRRPVGWWRPNSRSCSPCRRSRRGGCTGGASGSRCSSPRVGQSILVSVHATAGVRRAAAAGRPRASRVRLGPRRRCRQAPRPAP